MLNRSTRDFDTFSTMALGNGPVAATSSIVVHFDEHPLRHAIEMRGHRYRHLAVVIVDEPRWQPNSHAEKELQVLLRQFPLDALAVRVRRQQANKQATMDAQSRARRQSQVTKRVDGRRMQTYQAALAVRTAGRLAVRT